MGHLWLGATPATAQFIFLLPNKPVLPDDYVGEYLHFPDMALLTELNGNHWRKIFTIMAKLVVPMESHWRDYRDKELFKQTAIVFSVDQLKEARGKTFIVGNGFREVLPIEGTFEVLGSKQLAYVATDRIWCPYLDYRQFPNILIAALRECI
ncbi:DUF6942 family protein [Marinomonas transparens]|uniref:Uncharacterized protein n=1 Tax=Marinomonas transparens TaxID=2795388 RepID=A0A934JTS9_9GAMM|nr:hypothetical protein [Marinomonas transparens]MBJ7538176.1 hypothetical protein [Marinomonas transparens]